MHAANSQNWQRTKKDPLVRWVWLRRHTHINKWIAALCRAFEMPTSMRWNAYIFGGSTHAKILGVMHTAKKGHGWTFFACEICYQAGWHIGRCSINFQQINAVLRLWTNNFQMCYKGLVARLLDAVALKIHWTNAKNYKANSAMNGQLAKLTYRYIVSPPLLLCARV